jgi:hypothetical protein
MPIMDRFDPQTDGWQFENWGEEVPYCLGSCEFSWDLYRETYLGINPTHDWAESPLDCTFYEIYKKCAEKGNCGGMSLLALALFKYGGYMGFCSPASFYVGTKNPPNWKCTARDDLHRAINIFQARQFSAHGIENFLDVVDAGNLNNADAAFQKVKELLGKGDYPLLSIATGYLGDAAHTVIPFDYEENPAGYPTGTRILHIWDPNHPYLKDTSHYSGSGPGTPFHLVIHSATDWQYTSAGRAYPGTSGGWCFVVPMSVVLGKARQPMALDMVFDALMTAFVTGPGAAVTQVTDSKGNRLYTSDDEHLLRSDLETDTSRRLGGVGRWPWYADAAAVQMPGELYFMRRYPGEADLEFTLRGGNYKLVTATAGNLLEIEIQSPRRSADKIRLSRLATAERAVEVQALDRTRTVHLRQLCANIEGADWRSMEVRNARVGRDGLVLRAMGDLRTVEFQSRGLPVEFDLEFSQRREGQVAHRSTGRLKVGRGGKLHVAPDDWRYIDKSKIRTSFRQ